MSFRMALLLLTRGETHFKGVALRQEQISAIWFWSVSWVLGLAENRILQPAMTPELSLITAEWR